MNNEIKAWGIFDKENELWEVALGYPHAKLLLYENNHPETKLRERVYNNYGKFKIKKITIICPKIKQ